MPQLTLFVKPTCPHCRKVMRFLSANGVEVPLRDVTFDDAAYVELVEHGGRDEAPCLKIDDRYLYKSDDIIAWVKENVLAAR